MRVKFIKMIGNNMFILNKLSNKEILIISVLCLVCGGLLTLTIWFRARVIGGIKL